MFVVTVTMIREAIDDFKRFLRDRDINKQQYKKLTRDGIVSVESAKIKVGDLIILEKVCVTLTVSCDLSLFRVLLDKSVVFLAGTSCRQCIFTAGIDYNEGDMLVTST